MIAQACRSRTPAARASSVVRPARRALSSSFAARCGATIPARPACDSRPASATDAMRADRLARHIGARLRRRPRRRVARPAAGARSGARSSATRIADFARVESRRRLAEESARGRPHADELAAIRREVEIGLEDLRLGPRALERARGRRSGPTSAPACAARRRSGRSAGLEQARELHRQRRAAARPAAVDGAPRAVPRGDGEPGQSTPAWS